MKLDIKKGNIHLAYIQCGKWATSNLQSDGLSLDISQDMSRIIFSIDTSVNQRTRNKETNSYLDSIELIERINHFQYLTISDTAIVKMLSGRIQHFQNKDKTKCIIEIKLNTEGALKTFPVYPSISNELKLTKIEEQ